MQHADCVEQKCAGGCDGRTLQMILPTAHAVSAVSPKTVDCPAQNSRGQRRDSDEMRRASAPDRPQAPIRRGGGRSWEGFSRGLRQVVQSGSGGCAMSD